MLKAEKKKFEVQQRQVEKIKEHSCFLGKVSRKEWII